MELQLERSVYFVSFTFWSETSSVVRFIINRERSAFLQINPLNIRWYQPIFNNNKMMTYCIRKTRVYLSHFVWTAILLKLFKIVSLPCLKFLNGFVVLKCCLLILWFYINVHLIPWIWFSRLCRSRKKIKLRMLWQYVWWKLQDITLWFY